MFCTQCGTQLTDDSKFCYKCGAPTHLAEQKDSIEQINHNGGAPAAPAPQPQAQPQSTADDGVFGILGFIMAFFFPIIGMIFSIIGMSKKKNSGLALAGFIIALVLIVAVVVVVAAGDKKPAYLLLMI